MDSSDLVAATIEDALSRHRLMEEGAQRKLDDLLERIHVACCNTSSAPP